MSGRCSAPWRMRAPANASPPSGPAQRITGRPAPLTRGIPALSSPFMLARNCRRKQQPFFAMRAAWKSNVLRGNGETAAGPTSIRSSRQNRFASSPNRVRQLVGKLARKLVHKVR